MVGYKVALLAADLCTRIREMATDSKAAVTENNRHDNLVFITQLLCVWMITITPSMKASVASFSSVELLGPTSAKSILSWMDSCISHGDL